MGMSNYIPSSALTKAGVCTSSTRPASPYDGQVIYETDTDRTLVWNGSAWVFLSTSTANPPGLELITSQTVGSAVSTVTVNNCFSSTYENYRIVYSAINPSTNNDLNLKLTTGGTPSSTGYYWGFIYVNLSTLALTGAAAANTSSHHIGSVTSTAFRHAGTIDLLMPNLAQYTGIVASDYLMRTDIAAAAVTGSHQVATSYDGFQIIASSGTLTGGTIRVYGYKN